MFFWGGEHVTREKQSLSADESLSERVIAFFLSIKNWQLVLLTILFSEIITAASSIFLSFLWWGEVSLDLIQIGAVIAAVNCIILAPAIIYLVRASTKLFLEKSTLRDEVHERMRSEYVLRKTLDRRDILIRENHHRMKNNLSIVQSLLSEHFDRMDSTMCREYYAGLENRLASMALVHERLYLSGDIEGANLSEYLKDLVENIFVSYNANASPVAVTVDAPGIRLDMDTMVPCGLIVNELVTNTLRHAFRNGREGELTVVASREQTPWLLLVVKDNGVGLPEGLDIRNTPSFGMRIVTSLVSQVGGSMDVLRDAGTEFRIMIPEGAHRRDIQPVT
jgi:two-component sensor histidine kinase